MEINVVFPGPVGTQECKNLSTPHREVDPFQGTERPKVLCHSRDLQDNG